MENYYEDRILVRRGPHPGVAAVLSVLIPGLGQVYVGYYQRGFVHAIVVAVLVSIAASLDHGSEDFAPLVGMLLPFFWLYNIVDAGRRAAAYNRALLGGEEIALPSDFAVPSIGGSGYVGALRDRGELLCRSLRISLRQITTAQPQLNALAQVGRRLQGERIQQ